MASSALHFLLTLCPERCPIRPRNFRFVIRYVLLPESPVCCLIARSIRTPGAGGGQTDRGTNLDLVWALFPQSQFCETSPSLAAHASVMNPFQSLTSPGRARLGGREAASGTLLAPSHGFQYPGMAEPSAPPPGISGMAPSPPGLGSLCSTAAGNLSLSYQRKRNQAGNGAL